MYSINSVEDLQELNPYIIVGCGGGGEKFSNLEGIETVGFLDDNPAKQGKPFCGLEVASSLSDLFESTEANTVAIMLPIGAEGTALKYAVQALANGKNAVVSFRSLSLSESSFLPFTRFFCCAVWKNCTLIVTLFINSGCCFF